MTRKNYILSRAAAGDTRAPDVIGAEFDALVASIAPPPDEAALAAAVERSNAVDAWLAKQDPGQDASEAEAAAWEELRRLPFEDQAARAGL